MPVAINMPQRKQEVDPLEKLANALQIAKTGFGIAADLKTLEEAKATKAAEAKLRDSQQKKLDRENAQADEETNPNSPLSVFAREQVSKTGKKVPDSATYSQLKETVNQLLKPPTPKSPLEEEFMRQKLEDSRNKREFEKTPEARLQKLNSGDKARYDNAVLGLKKTIGMDEALENGSWTFSAIGDNDFTRSLRLAAEAFGRMQSGGAINKDEEERFLKMSPTATDSKEQQRKKLEDMSALFKDRLRTLGFTPDEAGIPVTEIQYAKKNASAMGKTAGGAGAPKPKTIVQDGHTYTLNPETGEYE